MNHFIKVAVALSIAAGNFLLLQSINESFLIPAISSGLVFLIVIALEYLDEKLLTWINSEEAFFVGIFLFISFGIAYFLQSALAFQKLPHVALVVYIVLGYLGLRLGTKFYKKAGAAILSDRGGVRTFNLDGEDQEEEVRDKILDTSVVIDGRILDIADTHFIDGPLILPNFVLREIQLISDSSDPIKRARGRRGLDMLNKLQRKGSIEVKITYADYTDTREVDAKLIKLARDTGGKLVTNDFNLNKVAELQGVKVLNLNNLANALKPVVLPGEELTIQVIKEGKDENQGIGYLEDGTMVVIENGGHLVGKDVKVSVTSIIQTAAGKMIFTKAIR
ncbi:MAG: TRAM domain-containing protein [Leptospiraceae bacterium]|nr:TRAM domain-containing protein [Leptospiraceae bacterium]MCP5512849.1 TRAM domain-containing protein [Leptospiraceae bacterium]